MRNVFIKPYVFCKTYFRQFIKDTRGAALIEYAIILVIVGACAALIRPEIKAVFDAAITKTKAIATSISS
ncbi:Flp family type IVb pilin [Candidatus Williamhamiltonella defendens]|uniref:Uncharacterized protein n=1 Tax=Candidatus Hamiltonella defensa (Bemisia tabaci) TaxID=672795 RepID=A0A249DW29_9ENTR|nr:hypothetical protein [Candidatus Hamiltonella defensa]ASX25748.1 hypothetical protein BA171_00825 [Candidatus Hamiltonella defensa (Bemisia tabaci)]CED78924.1 Flp/Fap pilin component superfamily protein [Candidatus Hamiltonella defensa (Bemisia tabaci)]